MTAILGGLGAAICWAASALCATAASRSIGANSAVAWIMMIGLAVMAPLIAVFAWPWELSSRAVLLLGASGVANIAGLAFEYRAFRLGKVGVVCCIASTEGMAATLMAVAAGAELSPVLFVILLALTAGVALAAVDTNATSGDARGDLRRLLLLSLPVPVMFGLSLFAVGELGSNVSLLWAVLPSRLVGTALIAAPMLARRTLQITARVLPAVAASAVFEILGFASYVLGSRAELSVSAVLASQFAALTTAGGYLLFGERLDRRQLVGLAVIASGVGALALIQA